MLFKKFFICGSTALLWFQAVESFGATFFPPSQQLCFGIYSRVQQQLQMSLASDAAFLNSRDESVYYNTILRQAISSCRNCLSDRKTLVEIEFPPSRKSDISVAETLAINRRFVRDLAQAWSSLGKRLWVVFPDNKEANLAQQDPSWGPLQKLPFTIASLDTLTQTKMTLKQESEPELIIAVNPGFNVDEWIKLAEVDSGVPTIIVNGNIDRLRNGYYPAFFYPGLARVSRSYYSRATQALFLSPIAANGNRFAGWLARIYPTEEWEVIVPPASAAGANWVVLMSSSDYPEPTAAWRAVKKANQLRYDGAAWL